MRLVTDHVGEYPSLTAAAAAVAKQLGVGKESVRRWVIQAQVDGGHRHGATTEELVEIKARSNGVTTWPSPTAATAICRSRHTGVSAVHGRQDAWITPRPDSIRLYGPSSTVARMKTTIELPDALARRAKAIARQHNLTLRELVTEGLRVQLDRLSAPAPPTEFRFRTVGGAGLQPDVPPESLIERAYDAS